MKSLIQSVKEVFVPQKTDRFILKCGYSEAELTTDEYVVVDRLLQGIMSGEVNPNSFFRCKRTGETFNLSQFSYLIRKKNPEVKVFGEDLKL